MDKDIKTVGELKELLNNYPDDMRVVYDCGLLLSVEEYELTEDVIVLNFD